MVPIANVILLVALCYSVYFFLFYKNSHLEKWLSSDPFKYKKVIITRLGGGIIFIIPAFLFNWGISFTPRNIIQSGIIFWIMGLCILAFIINFFAASKPSNLAIYPQIRKDNWTMRDIVISSLTWFFYLIGYEYLFRGVLLGESLKTYDTWSAISINIALYMLVHLPKGYKETFGSIPMGILLCLITISSGNVWPAIVVHTSMALSNEWFSIYYRRKVMMNNL